MYRTVIHQPRKGSSALGDERPLGGGIVGDLTQLAAVSYIRIEQNVEFDIRSGIGSGNTYTVQDKNGEQLFSVIETTTCCCRVCCGPSRSSNLMFLGQNGVPALQLKRHGCRLYCCVPDIVINDAFDEIVGSIKGPCSPSRCCMDLQFDVSRDKNLFFNYSNKFFVSFSPHSIVDVMILPLIIQILGADGRKVKGSIVKSWEPTDDTVNTDHDIFELYFPSESSVQDKALMIGGLFLVNFLYFEMS
ncbi:phospholipid scramblase 2-like [Tubulanus polymorphus]|uniref:phospholipid scramblase 2-like n=1 Tax=Tubulanus polymorphus TaxID=672921 RepID=UPI003DA53D88